MFLVFGICLNLCLFDFDVGVLYRFELYLLDYMAKKNMHKTAAIFRKEAKVCNNPVGNVVFLYKLLLYYAFKG